MMEVTQTHELKAAHCNPLCRRNRLCNAGGKYNDCGAVSPARRVFNKNLSMHTLEGESRLLDDRLDWGLVDSNCIFRSAGAYPHAPFT